MMKKNKSSSAASAQELVKQLMASGDMDAAWEKIRARLKIAPRDVWFLSEAGRICRLKGQLEEAKQYLRRALAVQPRDAGILNRMGLTFFDQENFTEAEKYYRRALSVISGYTACHNNYGILLHKQDRHREAAVQYALVLQHDPNYLEARYGLSSVLAHLQDLDGAETHLRRILQQAPNDARSQAALGMVLLQKGKFEEGWDLYRGRYAPDNPHRFVFLPQVNRPYWQGESLSGKSILVWHEQGHGDSIQFCRYVARLKTEKDARAVYMISRAELYPLLCHLPGIDQVLTPKQAAGIPEQFDCWTVMLDLPRHFWGRNDPFGPMPPYLQADAERLEQWRLAPDPAHPLTIGVVWKGTPKHTNDRHRSLESLSVLKPLWSVPGIRWISLQKGSGEEEAVNPPPDQPILALGHQVETFADTAALMAQMDLVITVDTSTAHLAGALNIPCWVMVPFISKDWRWLEGRDDSPWYPAMRLFHQKPDTGWDETILRIQAALGEWAAQKVSGAMTEKKNPAARASAQQVVKQLLESGKTNAALEKILSHLKSEPDDVWFLFEAGRIHRRTGQLEEAKCYYGRALAQKPNDAEILAELGMTFFFQNSFTEAETYYLRALNFLTGYTITLHNYCVLLQHTDRYQEAASLYEKALRQNPDHTEARYDLGIALLHLQDLDGVETHMRQVLEKTPTDIRAQNALGMALLQKGKFAEGWRWYRARYASDNPLWDVNLPKTSQPYWQGGSLSGKNIMVCMEQGFGDNLQFCRYVRRLKTEKGARTVYMICKPDLYPLLRRIPDVNWIPVGDQLISMTGVDCWVMLLDLPHHFLDSDDPFGMMPPYLQTDEEKRGRRQLAPDPGNPLTVGVVWKGRPTHNNDRHRSLENLSVLKPLWKVSGIRWVSLQKGPGEEEAQNADADQPILAMGHQLETFADTAALVAQMDLVITVDTSVAHLAGAMNIPCWVMLPFIMKDWRWLEGRDDSPWYPSMRLFHRKPDTGWDEAILRIQAALEEWASLKTTGTLIPPDNPSAERSTRKTIKHLLESGKTDAALETIRSHLELAPDDIWLLQEAGRICSHNKQLDEAGTYYARALVLAPHNVETLYELGQVHFHQDNFAEAEKYYSRTLALSPDHALCLHNYGVALSRMGRHQEAVALYEKALHHAPNFLKPRFGLGVALQALQDLDGAEKNIRAVLQQNPNDTLAQCTLGMVLLQKGNFEEGWRWYRSRYVPNNPLWAEARPKTNQPYWQGESLIGKTIMVYFEQGIGDTLQFCRYVMRLKAEKGAKAVYMICRSDVYPLLHHLPDVQCFPLQEDRFFSMNGVDTWTMLLDLPRHFVDSDDPFGVMPPYLEADKKSLERWRLEPDPRYSLTIGVAWKGSPRHNNDSNRSLESLTVLKPLWSVPGIRWISLQKGPGEDEALNAPADQPIIALGHRLETFDDTAALMAQMDLVITVDTSVAHLAGAMGIPCWVLIPSILIDWRWLEDRDDSPWYPSMRLFRQKPGAGWDETVLRIEAVLKDRVNAPPAQNAIRPTARKKELSPSVLARQAVIHLLEDGPTEAALEKICHRLKQAPDDIWFLKEAGRICLQENRFEEAKSYFQRALALQPRNEMVLNDLGTVFFRQGEFSQAEALYRRALALSPNNAACWGNLGLVLYNQDQYREAVGAYKEALHYDPDNIENRFGLGTSLMYLQEPDEAETQFRQLLQQAPDDSRTQCALGMVLLQKSHFAEGWPLYRGRYANNNPIRLVTLPNTNQPYWQGESLSGKSIVVFLEQGMGDCLQFCRYVTRLKTEKGAGAVYMVCATAVHPLLVSSLPDVKWIPLRTHENLTLNGTYTWTMLLDLPYHFLNSDEPFGVMPPYLRADEESLVRWQLAPDIEHPFTIGVVWKGRPIHKNDRHRSLENLAVLKPLWSVPGIRWVSLQKGPGEEEAQNADADQPILAMGHQLETFADTAALVAQMDLVITVDTSVAHLAGAMNIPCWVMLPFIMKDWRWLKDRDDSPWYPSMRLFHRKPDTGWDETMVRVCAALRTWASSPSAENKKKSVLGKDKTSSSASAQQTVRHLLESGQRNAALEIIRFHLVEAPDEIWFLQEAGRICSQSKQLEDARNYYEHAMALEPNNAETLYGLGLVHFHRSDFAEAEKYYSRTLELCPDHTLCLHNYGAMLSRSGRHQKAALLYEKVLHHDPNFIEACFGLGVSLKALQDLDGAEKHMRRVLQETPNDSRIQCALGMVLLQKGKFAEGWLLYRGRYAPDNPHRFTILPKINQRHWQGESLVGKNILIYAEQGFGDSIQFCRYAARLKKEKGARAVYMMCQSELYSMMKHLPDIDRVLVTGQEEKDLTENVDCWAMLLDLPYYFGGSAAPFGIRPPYFQADEKHMAQWRLAPDAEHPLTVGIAWKGRPTHNNDSNRSLDNLKVLKPLWRVPGIRWVSLQKGPGEEEALNADADQPIIAMGCRVENFADTAALITQLDLVVSVDTSVVHLAGSLNIPCWVMIPSISTDWRWLEDRDDSPWYPSMRLFRQKPDVAWDETIVRILEALDEWAKLKQVIIKSH